MIPATPARPASVEERLEPVPVDRVHVRHDGDRHVQRGLGDRREDVRGPRARLERQARCLLDHPAVHHGVRERDADLDRVGARVLDRAEQRRVDPGVPAGDVRDERRPPASRRARSTASRSRIRRLQRGQDRVEVLVAAAGQADQHARSRRERPRQQPPDHVRRLERRQDALGPGERLEARERLRRRWPRRSPRAPRPSGTRARARRPGSRARPRSNACRRPDRPRPGAGSSARRAGSPGWPCVSDEQCSPSCEPRPPASTPISRTPGAPTNAVNMPIALLPPPTQATTTSGSPPSRSAYCARASSPITRCRSRTSTGNGCGPTTEPMM